jgi:sulfur-oxidizing protein SoxZ
MSMTSARIVVPKTAKRGEVVEIKTLIKHPMETGYRRDHRGQPIPRHIIQRFVATYNGEEVFSADLTQGVAANPYLAFSLLVEESGEITFTWTDDLGSTHTEKAEITVA